MGSSVDSRDFGIFLQIGRNLGLLLPMLTDDQGPFPTVIIPFPLSPLFQLESDH